MISCKECFSQINFDESIEVISRSDKISREDWGYFCNFRCLHKWINDFVSKLKLEKLKA